MKTNNRGQWSESINTCRALLLTGALCCFAPASLHAADGSFALSFDGVDDYVFTPHLVTYNASQLTVTAWVKTTQTAGEAGLVNKYVAGSLNGWNLFLFNGEVRAWYFRDNANFIWDGGGGLNGGFVADGQWHHVAFVVDSTGASLYVDGVNRASRGWTGASGPTTTTQEVRLGSYPGSGFYRGLIDEVVLWSRALSTADISMTRSNSLLGMEPGLDAFGIYFRLTEGAGTRAKNTVFDNEFRAGRLTNGVAWVPGVLLRPGVATLPPNAVTSRSGRLNGVCSPGGTNTGVWFQWGTTTNYGNVTPAQVAGSGGDKTNFIQSLTGLTAGVTIHYRAVASNALGLAFGTNASFAPRAGSMTQERGSHTATLLPNGKVLVAGGYGASVNSIGFPTNTAELFDPTTGIWTPTAPMTTNHGLHTATLLLNGTVLVVDFFGAEIFDPVAGTWTRTGSPAGAHNVHTATLLQNGKVLVAGGIGNFPELYDPVTGNWTPTGQLITPRDVHTATLLPNGKVLVAGGETGIQTVVASAELYDPVSGTWSNTGPMNVPRETHSATLLINGQVLVGGGTDGTNYLASSERYNPVTGTWSRVGEPLVHARGYHTATLLPRGAVLIVGGYPEPDSSDIAEVLEMNSDVWRSAAIQPGMPHLGHTATLLPGGEVLLAGGSDEQANGIADVELYDPHTAAWTTNAPMARARYAHTSTLLPDGRVLVADFGNAQVFHPAINAWSNAPALNTPRLGHTATLLTNGKVLVAGGSTNSIDALASAELFDPASGLWMNTGPLAATRNAHTATLLPDGRVLVAGGVPGGLFAQPIASAELYHPVTGFWTNAAPLTSRRSGHSATLLPNGKVLVAGGSPDNFSVVSSAELYDPLAGTWIQVAPMTTNRTGHKATLLPNGTVLVAGGSPNTLSLPHFSAEVFDPATDAWKAIAPMIVKRHNPSATLLGNGRVLIAGGVGEGYLRSAELYDPATRQWFLTASKTTGTMSHASTLLPNGKVLVTGGWTGNGGVTLAELYDGGLGFQPLWQPIVTSRTSPLAPGDNLVLGGLRFRGVSGASHGRDKDSPSDNPVVQLRSLESERTSILSSTNWSTNAFTSLPVGDFPPGWAMATLFVNGMPGTASILEIIAPAPLPALTIEELPPASIRLSWPASAAGFTLQFNTSLNISNWTAASPLPADTGANKVVTNAASGGRKFYRLFKP